MLLCKITTLLGMSHELTFYHWSDYVRAYDLTTCLLVDLENDYLQTKIIR